MFKRLTWMTMGTGMGVGLTLWGQRKARARLARYQPNRVATDIADGARRWGSGLRSAAEEGRHAMRRREEELRGQRPMPPPMPSELPPQVSPPEQPPDGGAARR